MKKKNYSVIFILLAFILTITILCGSAKVHALAKEINTEKPQSKSLLLIEPDSNSVIYSYNENEKLPIASMCKIMTLLLCFESIDNGELSLDQTITISNNAASMGGSQVFLEENGEYKIGELIKSIVVSSANDACVAMAETICGSEDNFIEKMNQKAKELKMDDTIFVNCTGLPKPGQYSCAKDVAKMFSELIKHEEYFRFSKIWTDKVAHPKDRFTEISNTNKLIRFYEGCDGGKTGYTSEAGHCLAATATRNGMRLISVAISAPSSKQRFKEVSDLFNYGFNNFTNKVIVDNNKPLDLKVEVIGGKKNTLEVIAEKSIYVFSEKNQKKSYEINFTPLEKIKAPINIGDCVGSLTVYENGVELKTVKVLSNEQILRKTYFDNIKDISTDWAIV